MSNSVNCVNSVNSVNINDESWKELFLFGQENVMGKLENGGSGLYSFSYFRILFDKNEVPEHSLFDIELEKRRQNGVHTLLLFDKNGV